MKILKMPSYTGSYFSWENIKIKIVPSDWKFWVGGKYVTGYMVCKKHFDLPTIFSWEKCKNQLINFSIVFYSQRRASRPSELRSWSNFHGSVSQPNFRRHRHRLPPSCFSSSWVNPKNKSLLRCTSISRAERDFFRFISRFIK